MPGRVRTGPAGARGGPFGPVLTLICAPPRRRSRCRNLSDIACASPVPRCSPSPSPSQVSRKAFQRRAAPHRLAATAAAAAAAALSSCTCLVLRCGGPPDARHGPAPGVRSTPIPKAGGLQDCHRLGRKEGRLAARCAAAGAAITQKMGLGGGWGGPGRGRGVMIRWTWWWW
jgi:hypothetical protein